MSESEQPLDALDRELAELREAEAAVLYEADAGKALGVERLQAIAEQRRDLVARLGPPARMAATAAEPLDPLAGRKAELLALATLRIQIEDDPDVIRLRNELEQAARSFGSRLASLEGMCSYLWATEACARRLLRATNAAAMKQGYASYPEAKLASQELAVPVYRRTLDAVARTCRNDLVEAIKGAGDAELRPGQLEAHVRQSMAPREDAFPVEERLGALAATLGRFGVQPEVLPIRFESYDSLPYSGAVHALKIRRDIRVVLGKAKPGFDAYSLLLHEFGHAFYYAHAPDGALLLDDRIAREGLAEVWACLIEREQWLREFTALSASEIDEFLASRKKVRSCILMALVREARFELALHQNPEADFLEVWNRVTRDCLGIDRRSTVYSEFVFLCPLDIKDYVFADLLATAAVNDLEKRFGRNLHRPEVWEFLVKHYCQSGNFQPWHRRFPPIDDAIGIG